MKTRVVLNLNPAQVKALEEYGEGASFGSTVIVALTQIVPNFPIGPVLPHNQETDQDGSYHPADEYGGGGFLSKLLDSSFEDEEG